MVRHISKILVLNFFITFLALSGYAQGADQKFHYAVRVPQTSRSCQQEAEALATTFAIQKGVTVLEAACRGVIPVSAKGESYNLYSLLLTYQSASKAKITSVTLSSGLLSQPGDGQGIYESYSACLADIPNQLKNFVAATSLTPLDTFCSNTPHLGGNLYKMQIDGFGVMTHSLYVFNPRLSVDADEDLLIKLQALVANSGGLITRVYGTQIFYYSKYDLNLSSRMMGLFHNANECLSQIDAATEIVKKGGATQAIVRCLRSTKVSAGPIFLQAFHDGYPNIFEDVGYTNTFYSFDECMGERARIIGDSGVNTLGGICQPALGLGNQYLLDLFFRR